MKKEPKKKNDAADKSTVIGTTVSLSGHVSQGSRDRLTTYQRENGFKNVSDALNQLLSQLPDPTPEVEPEPVPDPNQTALPGCEEP